MNKKNIIFHHFNNASIPIKVSIEWRKNTRISIGQNFVYLRLPRSIDKNNIDKQIHWGKKWLDAQLAKNPEIVQKYLLKDYRKGDELHINGKTFLLDIVKQKRKTATAKLVGNTILIIVPEQLEPSTYSKTVKQLISRIMAHYFIDEIDRRIRDINRLYFKYEINEVKMKYNKSNWGSCSALKNINISSRLLFAPSPVQDYVFIHELTHLKEMNHSVKFWNKVKAIVPDYKQMEKWLKQNSHLCDF